MNIVTQYNLRKSLLVIFTVIIVTIILWFCLVITDYVRYRMDKIPLFAILEIKIADFEDGYEETYTGIGYKYVETQRDSDFSNKFYVLGIKLK